MGVAVEGFGKNLEEDMCATTWNTDHRPLPTSTHHPSAPPVPPLGICDHMIGAVEIPANIEDGHGETRGCRLEAGSRFTTALRLVNDWNNHEAVRLGQE